MPRQAESFTLNEQPHVATVGSKVFLFKPEVYSDELLEAWSALRAETLKVDAPGDDAAKIAERTRATNLATKQFLAELMLDDDALAQAIADAADTDEPLPAGAMGATGFLEMKLPDRVQLQMQRWILGVYGLRPTGPSSGSSTGSPTETPGDDSTGSSPSAA